MKNLIDQILERKIFLPTDVIIEAVTIGNFLDNYYFEFSYFISSDLNHLIEGKRDCWISYGDKRRVQQSYAYANLLIE